MEEIAEKYNSGEKYSESIAYIYSRIVGLVNQNEKYQKEFCIDSVEEMIEISQ